jgi:transcriptional regulator with XRE-family HTH domain
MISMETSIHQRIKKRREALGLSMQGLADLVGVAAWQTVQQWEKEGGTAPKRDRLEAVAKALQTTPETLLFGDEARSVRREQIRRSLEAADAGVSYEALEVARAFDKLKKPAQRAAVISQLTAFGVLSNEGQ